MDPIMRLGDNGTLLLPDPSRLPCGDTLMVPGF